MRKWLAIESRAIPCDIHPNVPSGKVPPAEYMWPEGEATCFACSSCVKAREVDLGSLKGGYNETIADDRIGSGAGVFWDV